MSNYQPKQMLGDFIFLEGPRWHDGALWLSDMWDHCIYRILPNGEKSVVARVENRPSGLGFLPDNTLIVASMTDRTVYKLVEGKLVVHADLGGSVQADINDIVVDNQGRTYVGNFGYDLFNDAEPRTAELIMIEKDGSFRVVAEDLQFPNGMVIKNNNSELVVAETFGHCLSIFDINKNGDLSNRRTLASFDDITPDGICLDAEDHIWVASYMTGEFIRVNPQGKTVDGFKVDGAAVACQLGGEDGHTLFCLVYDGEISDIAKGKRGARIETVTVQVAAGGSP